MTSIVILVLYINLFNQPTNLIELGHKQAQLWLKS